MSSFYDDASLVVIPSGYKTSKVYAEKPTDGSGDLTFTRTGDTATRVNSAGLIEKVRTNLILQSQTFDNASWGKDTTTVTANAEVAPDGTLTADTMTISTDASRVTQGPTIGAGSFTASVYVKIISQTTAGDVRFLGVVDGSVVNVNFTPTNQWARYTATFTAATQITSFQLRGVTSGFVGTIAIWGFQLEASDFGATDYIATTTAAVSVGPVANVPRLDYLGSTCPRLILEGQRTNLVTYSEQLDNAAWTKANCTISANAVISPSGYQDADNIVTTAANSDIGRLTATITANTATYTQSAFFKWVSGYEFVKYRIALVGGTAQAAYLDFNARTGAFSASDTTYKIESYGNGWFRVSFQITNNGTNTSLITQIYPTNVTTATQTLSAWGFQVEAGAYVTSLIPTLAASATRGADVCSKTGISSLIGQTEGTIFAEIYPEEFIDGSYIGISDGTFTNRIIFGFEGGAGNLLVFGNTGLSGAGTYTRGQKIKIAIAYKSGSSALYVNGASVTTSSGTFTASYSQFNFNSGTGSQNFYGKCSQALLFKTRLTNAELAELTTL